MKFKRHGFWVGILPPLFAGLMLFSAGSSLVQADPPIVEPCGGDGQKLCNPGGKVDAIRVGKAKMWGCGGKNIYFTPHNGGECWSCPEGFKRTTTPVYKPDSCKKRGLKLGKKERTNATFVRSAYGCEAGQYHKGLSCYTCPAGSEKIAILKAFNPGKSCRVISCEAGLKPSAKPPKALQDLGHEFNQVCAPPTDVKEFIRSNAQEQFSKRGLGEAAKNLVADVFRNDQLRSALKQKQYVQAMMILRDMRSYQELKRVAQDYGYRSLSIGVATDVQVIAGANQEFGIAVDWDDNIRGYATTGLSLGLAVGGDVGVNVGIWKVPAAQLGGYAQGLTFSVAGGLGIGVGASLGAGLWASYYPYEILGVSYTAGGGVGGEVGEYNEVVTNLYQVN